MSTTISGTQSPPLEATGEDKCMGVSSIKGGPVECVPDRIQRQQYFEESPAPDSQEEKAKASGAAATTKGATR